MVNLELLEELLNQEPDNFTRESMSFYDRLRKAQRDTKNSLFFEEALTEAFKRLGFSSKHIGGRDEPDILLEVLGHKIVIDAKTATDPIGEARVNFDALERYKKSYRADHVGVVAIGFTRGVVRETAKERHVILIETEAICKALQNHANYPYNPQHIYEMMFEDRGTVITSRGINPSTEDVSRHIGIVKKVLLDLKRLQESGEQFGIDETYTAYHYYDRSVGREEIESAIEFLSSPPFNIVKKDDNKYSFTIKFDEIVKRFGILYEALPRERVLITRSTREVKKGRGISIQGQFVPCRRSKDILIETAEWLIKRDRLKVPIEAGYKRYLVSREPKHRSGEPFTAGEKLSNGWWIETHYSTRSCIRYARRLLKECGFREEDLDVHDFVRAPREV